MPGYTPPPPIPGQAGGWNGNAGGMNQPQNWNNANAGWNQNQGGWNAGGQQQPNGMGFNATTNFREGQDAQAGVELMNNEYK